MKRVWTASLLASLATIALSGCLVDLDFDEDDRHGHRIHGSGRVITEFRQLPSFTAVAVSGVGRVIIERANRPFVEITADDNVLPYLESHVRGGMLTLGTRSGVSFDDIGEIVYYVGVPYMDEIFLSGAVRGEAYEIDTDYLFVELSGATSLLTEGWARDQEVILSGVASYRALDLESLSARIVASGTANATVWVRERLGVTASGVSWIRYDGNPALDLRVSGLASVRRY